MTQDETLNDFLNIQLIDIHHLHICLMFMFNICYESPNKIILQHV